MKLFLISRIILTKRNIFIDEKVRKADRQKWQTDYIR